jgi:thioredoxin reductase (NADPH)
MTQTKVAIIGAGPIGLELAVALKKRGVDYLIFDKGSIGSTIGWFPEGMSFFSSNDRIAIAGLPIQNPGQTKATKEEYLAYLRSVAQTHALDIHTFERVTEIDCFDETLFQIATEHPSGRRIYEASHVVLAIGDTDKPNLLNIPGEDLPHVSHYFRSPHETFGRKVLIVGGKNSAAEAALRCYHAGAEVILSYRRAAFRDKSVKYWLLPELLGRIERGEITCHYDTQPTEIRSDSVVLQGVSHDRTTEVDADQVLLLTGYLADSSLFENAGVTLTGDNRVPTFDPKTMMTNVNNLYIAGTAIAGTQSSYTVFLENCHIHVDRIMASILGDRPPAEPQAISTPEA